METANNVRTLPAPRLRPELAGGLELSSVWFSLETRPWTTLVVVPATADLPAREVALSLLAVGVRASREPPTLIDASRLTPEGVAEVLSQLEEARVTGRRALVVVDAPSVCAPALALIRRCDAALLCVGLGDTRFDEARRTLAQCGRERFLGSVVLSGEGG